MEPQSSRFCAVLNNYIRKTAWSYIPAMCQKLDLHPLSYRSWPGAHPRTPFPPRTTHPRARVSASHPFSPVHHTRDGPLMHVGRWVKSVGRGRLACSASGQGHRLRGSADRTSSVTCVGFRWLDRVPEPAPSSSEARRGACERVFHAHPHTPRGCSTLCPITRIPLWTMVPVYWASNPL